MSRTLYVCGPMSGLPSFNYPAFDLAQHLLEAKGFTVLNPTANEQLNPTPGTPQRWDWYMRHSIKQVLAAEGIALLPGWEDSRGAKLEVQIAQALGLPVNDLDVWVEEWA